MNRHGSPCDGACRAVIPGGVCLNAKGYERLESQLVRNEKIGGGLKRNAT